MITTMTRTIADVTDAWQGFENLIAGPGGSEFDDEPIAPPAEQVRPPSFVNRLDTRLIPSIAGLTPNRLRSILAEADDGQPERLFEAIMQIPQRDGHWRGITTQRRLSVASIGMFAKPLGDSDAEESAASDMNRILVSDDMRCAKRHLLTGEEFGFAVVQIVWVRGDLWRPRFRAWDPRHFEVSDDGQHILRRGEDGALHPLMPGSWIVHAPQIGLGATPVQRGLGRLGLLLTMLKYSAVNQWWAFADVFGIPLRQVTIAKNDDAARARKEARKVASDGVMVLRQGQRYEVMPNNSADGGDLWPEQLAWVDQQMSVGILGQTMTTVDGSSRSQAEVHERVGKGIRDDSATELASTLARDLYRWYAVFNYGLPVDAEYTIEPAIKKRDDPDKVVEIAAKLREFGIEVDQEWLAGAALPDAPFETLERADAAGPGDVAEG